MHEDFREHLAGAHNPGVVCTVLGGVFGA
jgi:hypothetical protein